MIRIECKGSEDAAWTFFYIDDHVMEDQGLYKQAFNQSGMREYLQRDEQYDWAADTWYERGRDKGIDSGGPFIDQVEKGVIEVWAHPEHKRKSLVLADSLAHDMNVEIVYIESSTL